MDIFVLLIMKPVYKKHPLLLIVLIAWSLIRVSGQEDTFVERISGTPFSFKMKLIPAGVAELGDRKVKAELDAYYIGTHEVTFDEFNCFKEREQDNDSSGQATSAYKADAVTRPTPQYVNLSFGMGERGGFPMVSMTQQGALRYCQWLYQKTGRFYRLPTEAEWEYACRAGTSNVFFFGDDDSKLGDYAWYYENSDDKYHKVGEKMPNPWGLYDMLGNVAEWTSDEFRDNYYELVAQSNKNPWMIPQRKHSRTVKGGAYVDDDTKQVSPGYRLKSAPRWQVRDPQIPKSKWWNTDSPYVGFRLVSPVKQVTAAEVEEYFKKAIVD